MVMLLCAWVLPHAALLAHQPIHWYQELLPWLGLLSLILYLAPREAWGWPRRICFQTAELIACGARITTGAVVVAMDRLAGRQARELRATHVVALQMREAGLRVREQAHINLVTSAVRRRAAEYAVRSHIRVCHVALAARDVPVPFRLVR